MNEGKWSPSIKNRKGGVGGSGWQLQGREKAKEGGECHPSRSVPGATEQKNCSPEMFVDSAEEISGTKEMHRSNPKPRVLGESPRYSSGISSGFPARSWGDPTILHTIRHVSRGKPSNLGALGSSTLWDLPYGNFMIMTWGFQRPTKKRPQRAFHDPGWDLYTVASWVIGLPLVIIHFHRIFHEKNNPAIGGTAF